MDIISHFNKFVEENFYIFFKSFFDKGNFWYKKGNIDNYISFMTNLDSFNYSFLTNVIKFYFEYIDDVFFHSSYRKSFCESKGFYNRTILTLFGEITFKRRYYLDKNFGDRFFFTDLFLNLPKRKYFDPFVCAELCNLSASTSYSKAGKIVASKVGKRINNSLSIGRASTRNCVMQFNINNTIPEHNKRIERLYVMLDEKFVGSQFNDGKDHMIKAAVIFEGTELVYKTRRKKDSMNRFRLINSYTCASIENKLLSDTIDYIYNTYDIDHIKEINFMGDCATWIKNFPKSNWFKFNPNTNIKFAMDGFHFSQALCNLTTNKYDDVYAALYEYVLLNKKDEFTRLCNEFLELNLERSEVIESKRDYILNNWNERQLYQNSPHMKCSMESHISHIFADIFTSRPKSYSKKGIIQLLKLRLLKINKKDIKEEYFKQFKLRENRCICKKEIIKNNNNNIYLNKLIFRIFGNYTI